MTVIKILKDLNNQGIPVLICGQFTKEKSHLGHLRIITYLNKKYVYLHDPHPETGGPNQRWTWKRFIESWQATGPEVTGGVYIVVRQKD